LAQASARLGSAQFLIKAIFLVLLAYLILYPLLELVWSTLVWSDRSVRVFRAPDAEPGAVTAFFWNEILFGLNASKFLYEPLVNSLLTGGIAAALAILFGGSLAWLVTRTDLPGRHWLKPLL